MPFGVKPECFKCNTAETSMWRKRDGGHLCNECHQKIIEEEKQLVLSKEAETPVSSKVSSVEITSTPKITLRKSTRMTRNYKTRQNPYALPKPSSLKGKGRRSVVKSKPMKSSLSTTSSPVLSNVVLHKGQYFKVGDVVSLQDIDGGIYYAQIRGLMTDSFCERSACISWLIPTSHSPTSGFDPSTFVIGPDEELPRKLDCMHFVMHAPSSYFMSTTLRNPACLALFKKSQDSITYLSSNSRFT